MTKIFIGFLLIFLDFSINFDTVTIGLLPDFIGYFLLIGSLTELAPQSTHFGKVKPFATIMAVYTVILYIIDLIGISALLGFVATLLGLFSTLISLFISYHIIQGVMDIEKTRVCNLNSTSLFNKWKFLASMNALAYLLIFIPGLNIVSIIASLIAGIVFLVGFSRTRKAYDQC